MKGELIQGLTEEQIAKAKACKNQEELLAVTKQEGIELNEEQLEAVNGGGCTSKPKKKCPKYGSKRAGWQKYPFMGCDCECDYCGYKWTKD